MARKKRTQAARPRYVSPSHTGRQSRTLWVYFASEAELAAARGRAEAEGRTLPALVQYLLRQHWKQESETADSRRQET